MFTFVITYFLVIYNHYKMLQTILHRTFLGNTIENYCWFAGIILLGLIFKRLLSKLLALFVYKFLENGDE